MAAILKSRGAWSTPTSWGHAPHPSASREAKEGPYICPEVGTAPCTGCCLPHAGQRAAPCTGCCLPHAGQRAATAAGASREALAQHKAGAPAPRRLLPRNLQVHRTQGKARGDGKKSVHSPNPPVVPRCQTMWWAAPELAESHGPQRPPTGPSSVPPASTLLASQGYVLHLEGTWRGTQRPCSPCPLT